MKTIILAILDGWGLSQSKQGNAIAQASIPNIKKIEKNYPNCSLQASGIAVGLPWNEAGNSEVGHLTIGSGRVVYQYLPRISLEIKSGQFFKNPGFIKTILHVRKNNSVLHLIGLISSGNVHSYLEHVYALLELARQEKIKKLCLHLFTDGKDSPLKQGKKILTNLQEKLKNPDWQIASLIGRFYAMDRNQNWDRTEKTYNLLTQAQGEKTQDPIKKLEEFYDQDITDTYIKPIAIVDENQKPVGSIKENDGVIFFNFREDSARQLARAFVLKDFDKFPRQFIKNLFFCTMTEYEKGLSVESAYPPIEIKNHLTEILTKAGKKILKVAETEKYAHVTYFFNGGKEQAYPNEERRLIPSNIVTHYDEYPEMQADEVTEEVIKGVKNYDLIIVNYANADMIGHTGNLKAGIKAVEAVDKTIKPLIGLAEKGECVLLITADHGNAEEMLNLQTGEPITKHSVNPVPFYLVGKEFKFEEPKSEEKLEDIYKEPQGILCDIAPTILALIKIPQPPSMTGKSLLDVLK